MKKTELVFVPVPGMGHLVPMVELAKQIMDRDNSIVVTVLIMKPPHAAANKAVDSYIESLNVAHDSSSISDPAVRFIQLPPLDPPPSSSKPGPALLRLVSEAYKPYIKQIMINSPKERSALELSVQYQLGGLVIDFLLTPLIDVGNEVGVPTYIYFTSSAAMLGFFLNIPKLDAQFPNGFSTETHLRIPSFANPVPYSVLPPSFSCKDEDTYRFFLDTARSFKEAKGIILNTFYELEPYALDSSFDGHKQNQVPPVYPVGPILELNAHGNSEQDSTRYDNIMEWLDSQPPSSVILLCFGSMGSLDEKQVKEIAIGLERSGQRFLWSLRMRQQPSSTSTFSVPNDCTNLDEVLPEGFLERTKQRGLVSGWVPQVAVLSHQAVGGFVSHCGWNSALESIWFGVPILTWPLYAEQQLNAFELVKELGLAVELRLDYKMNGGIGSGNYKYTDQLIVSAEEVEKGVKSLMAMDVGDGGVRKKVKEMKEKSRKALGDNNGSSFSSLGLFVENLKQCNL